MNLDKFSIATSFIFGGAIGVGATWRYFYSKYRKRVQEEVESIYKEKPEKSPDDISEKTKLEGVKEDPNDLINKYYTESTNQPLKEADISKLSNNIVFIKPEEVGLLDDYKVEYLTWYIDRCLVDEEDNLVDEPEEVIGEEAMRLLEDVSDIICVRNHELSTDFEITPADICFNDALDNR